MKKLSFTAQNRCTFLIKEKVNRKINMRAKLIKNNVEIQDMRTTKI